MQTSGLIIQYLSAACSEFSLAQATQAHLVIHTMPGKEFTHNFAQDS